MNHYEFVPQMLPQMLQVDYYEEQKLLELKTLLKMFDSSSRVGKHRYSGHFYLTRIVEAKYCETGLYEKNDYFDTIEELIEATNLLISENASNG